MNRAQIASDARLAGEVLRYHTWPVHRRQSVGEHTWQVMVLYWRVFGPLPELVSTYLLWHDAGEMATGDLPFPVKARNPDLKLALDGLEHDAVAAMGGPQAVDLPDYERTRCKIVDLLEMRDFGLREVAMGNTYAQPIVDDTLKAVNALLVLLSTEDRSRVAQYVAHKGALR